MNIILFDTTQLSHSGLNQNQNTGLYIIHTGSSVSFPPKSLASKTEIYTLDSKDLVCLKTCPGHTWQMTKCMTSPISLQVEQHCPGADYWQGICPVLVCRKRQILLIALQKGFNLSTKALKVFCC